MTDRITTGIPPLRGWRKSSYSNSEGGSCLEVLDGHPAGVPVRDSKTPHGSALIFSPEGWSHFLAAIRRADLRIAPTSRPITHLNQ
ncbi:DUF397 domain-containing protein [Streptomyces dioscori]|uniref:DUF397 domain-containing protein n=1 Tax=Streptomyces dioscori TaxID=2109333 RepID=A0A2P8QCA2_9ACTN|nr:DUF397 domain-containing protein [Streptomyces dioscori]PSM43838.1 DUF397 domain-containing protein [Streptomyces dioscori]